MGVVEGWGVGLGAQDAFVSVGGFGLVWGREGGKAVRENTRCHGGFRGKILLWRGSSRLGGSCR